MSPLRPLALFISLFLASAAAGPGMPWGHTADRACIDLFEEIDLVDVAFYESLPNREVRSWYLQRIREDKIFRQNNQWDRSGLTLRQRAQMTFQVRHEARLRARDLMVDRAERERIEARDLEKYGSRNGPTFNWLFQRLKRQGLSDDAAYEEIIESASHSNPVYNRLYGLDQ